MTGTTLKFRAISAWEKYKGPWAPVEGRFSECPNSELFLAKKVPCLVTPKKGVLWALNGVNGSFDKEAILLFNNFRESNI